jgi:hypothetical protein
MIFSLVVHTHKLSNILLYTRKKARQIIYATTLQKYMSKLYKPDANDMGAPQNAKKMVQQKIIKFTIFQFFPQ